MAALLHSIFFHRVFGNIQPLTHDILDVTFVYPPQLRRGLSNKLT
jgi:Autophagy-related protein 101